MRKLLGSMPIILVGTLLGLAKTHTAIASSPQAVLTDGHNIFAPASKLSDGVIVAGCGFLPDGSSSSAWLYLHHANGFESTFESPMSAGATQRYVCDGFSAAGFYNIPCSDENGQITGVRGFFCFGDSQTDPQFNPNCQGAFANVTCN
jgi:hypothetical protein